MAALIIQNLVKTYRSGVEALKGIDLRVEPGDFFALLGPNGAGKSTAIGIITHLVNKTSGSVHVFGHDIDQEAVQAKSCLGLVPQEINFNQFERVIDIVVNQAGFYGLPRQQALERAEVYLKKLGLWEKRFHVSRTLSGGMKRRLMIVRALVHHPKMLILDEPTAGVDIELRRSTWDFLAEINRQGTTIILTTHYLEEAEQMCRGIAIIDQGRIVENTTVKKLLNTLKAESLVLYLSEPIHQAPRLQDCTVTRVDEHTLEVSYPKSKNLNQLFEELSGQKVQVASMRNKSNRLEELFIQLINHHP